MESNIEAMNRISLNEDPLEDTCYVIISSAQMDNHQRESPAPEPADGSNDVPPGADHHGNLVRRSDASTQTPGSITVPTKRRSRSETGVSNVPRIDDDRSYKWQFLDCRGIWIDYGNVTSLGARDSGVYQSSDKIEDEYLKGHKCYFVKSKYNEYEVNFARMIQMNTHSQRIRPIRRIQKNFVVRTDGSQPWDSLPHYWADMGSRTASGPSTIVPLTPNSQEALHYTNIVSFFLPRSKIREFYRIQAPHLYRCYQIRKSSLEKLYPEVRYNEGYLYHGTQRGNVNYISQENVDWRRHGSANGQQEGCGAYFTNLFNVAAVFGIQKREISQNHPVYTGASAMPAAGIPTSLHPWTLPVFAAQPYLVMNANQTYSMVPPGILNPLQSATAFAPIPQNINGFLDLECSNGEKGITVIIAKVLTGRMRVGEENITVPGDDTDGVPFDTTVDSVIHPSVFVKYHIEEYYPEYCIVLDN